MQSQKSLTLLTFGILLLAAGVGFIRLVGSPNPHIEMAGYATTLRGRTQGQRHNARLAAEAINGKSIAPGQVFSFNRAVKSWSVDQGYVKAPVSFDGELVRAFGGGVCQTSTTLYNAALLAGCPILERHPHAFRPLYVPPGRDAAVAYPGVDLRFKNPYSWPIHIRATAQGDRLDVRLIGAKAATRRVRIETKILSHTAPARITRVRPAHGTGGAKPYLRAIGLDGYRVASYRVYLKQGRAVQREQLGDDTYAVMNDVTAVSETVSRP